MSGSLRDSNWPMVSVIVPVRNEARYLARCLRAIEAQDYPADRIEVLVVDGGSTDGSGLIAQECGSQKVRILDNQYLLAAPGLNIGIREARGEVIVRVDGHTIIAPDYVTECVRALEATGADVVGGPRRLQSSGFWGRVIAMAMASPLASPARFHRAGQVREVDSVFLGAFRRSTLVHVGLYDESLPWNEDYELNYRIRRAGGRVCSTPAVRSTYFPRESLVGLGKQFWRYGRGKAMVLKRHPGSVAARHLVAPVFVLSLLLSLCLAPLGIGAPLLALLVAYAIAITVFAIRAGGRRAAAVAVAFVCAHVAWGSGMLFELTREAAWWE